MRTVTPGQKIYFAAVGLLALWVGFWGYFAPEQVDKAIPWLVPPLHARFLGALYLSATVLMAGGILSHTYGEIRVSVHAVAIWTGMLFIVSLFYLKEFDYSRTQVWFWFGAYLVYPLIGLWLIWNDRQLREDVPGMSLPTWVRGYLMVQGILVTSLAITLLLFPEFMATLWPWKITRLLAHVYSAPFLAYGLSSLMLSRQQTWAEIRDMVTATFIFALGVLIASFVHRQVFSFLNISALLWFGGFLLATLVLGLLTVRTMRESRGAI